MKYFKSLVLAVVLCVIVPFVGKAQIYFGGGMSYNSNSAKNALGVMAKVGIGIADRFDINGNATYYLRKETPLSFDLDLHYRLINLSEHFLIHPFVGVNFTGSNNSIAFGTSFKVPTESSTYFFEPRYILDGKQWVFTLGIIL